MKLSRIRMHRVANAHGYVVDGNHVFSIADHAVIVAGKWRASVSERPDGHPEKIQRLAAIVQGSYSSHTP